MTVFGSSGDVISSIWERVTVGVSYRKGGHEGGSTVAVECEGREGEIVSLGERGG